jgi:predicted HD superfamily hydrolase involved in NAD metabolism
MTFETERCIIKPISSSDKQDLFSMCDDIDVWNYLGGSNTANFHRTNTENLEKHLPDPNRWTIRDKKDNAFFGYLSLGTHHDGEDTELSYLLLSKYWGNGYASEVVSEMVRYVFSERKLKRLVAETQSANLVSCRLLEKLGFYKLKELTRFNAEQSLYAIDNPCKINEIKNTLKQTLDNKRFAHTLAVCETAVELADRFGVDKRKAYLAALLHDCARGLNEEQQRTYCHEHGIELDEYMKTDINPVHALIGADMAKRHFGINDQDILDAINRHAVGGENMTLLDKVLFVADGIEPNRAGSDADEARVAAENDLDKAVVLVMTTIKSYYLKGKPMHPNAIKMIKKYTHK